MTFYQRVAILCLALTALPAYAADSNTDSERWTKGDVAAYCHSRFGDDDRSHGYQLCVTRNAKKIGRDKTPGEMQELDSTGGSQ